MKGMERPTPIDQNKDRPAESFMLLLNTKKNTYHSPNPLLSVVVLLSAGQRQDCFLPSLRPTFG